MWDKADNINANAKTSVVVNESEILKLQKRLDEGKNERKGDNQEIYDVQIISFFLNPSYMHVQLHSICLIWTLLVLTVGSEPIGFQLIRATTSSKQNCARTN